MSKLFDQLKDAARSREDKSSPGLLFNAMQRAKDSAAEAEAASAPTQDAAPAKAGTAPSTLAGIGLAVAIFAIVFVAWQAAPWRAPQRIKIDPAELKLDRSLDVSRTGGAGRSSLPGPAPSK